MSTSVVRIHANGDSQGSLAHTACKVLLSAPHLMRKISIGALVEERRYERMLSAEVEEYRSGRRQFGDWEAMKEQLGLD